MIVDCHTHILTTPGTSSGEEGNGAVLLSRLMPFASPAGLSSGGNMEDHLAASEPVGRSLVLGFKSRYLAAEIPNSLIAQYVRAHPNKLVGVAGIDPTNLPEALADLQAAYGEYRMKAITVSPSDQDFHPADSRAMQVFAEAARLRMPVIIDHRLHGCPAAKMEFARPSLLDEVARELPQLKIVIAHLGYPWVEECIVVLGKHANVFADISGLMSRPWHAYNFLLAAFQFGVMDKLLFASDYPSATPAAVIESLYRINQLVTGTNLPTVPRAQLVGIVERDALGMLGLEAPAPPREEKHQRVLDPHD